MQRLGHSEQHSISYFKALYWGLVQCEVAILPVWEFPLWRKDDFTTVFGKFEILQETLQATQLLKLLDKMCKYEMDPTKTICATEPARGAGRTDGRTDGQTDGWREWNQYTPNNFVVRGYNYEHSSCLLCFVCCRISSDIAHILYDYFATTLVIKQSSQCQQYDPRKYG